ncbi:MAG: DNA repair protein RecN, partial [Clostridia bacterium]|nr:DNA repair protein RecN [Clostridia bacterium]
NKALVRYGSDKAEVSAMFSVNDNIAKVLEQNGISAEDDSFIINREITADGRSIARINGSMVPLALSRDLSHLLIDIHGQLDNQALLTQSKHIDFLDSYAGNSAILDEYKNLYDELRKNEKELNKLSQNEQERLSKIDLLKYQIDELSKAKLISGEEEELEEESAIISNSEKITEAVNGAYNDLYDSELSAYDNISSALSKLSSISEFDDRLSDMYSRLNDAVYAVEDVSHELREYLSEIEFDPERYDEVSERLDLIKKLKRKYGGSVDACIEFLNNAQEEADILQNSDERCEQLTSEIKKIKAKMEAVGERLTDTRKKAAVKLAKEIEKNLHELDMDKAQFCVSIKKFAEYTSKGFDDVEFIFTANPGQPMKGLAAIASGGELSRVMLAMKTVLADSDRVDTLIFDEIDTGVSGSAASKIAKKLALLGKSKQVICISHQPQLAAESKNHFKITKNVSDNNTRTEIKKLDREERIREVARIIDGSSITETSVLHAKEMLERGFYSADNR